VPPPVISTRETIENSTSPEYTIEARWPVLEWGGDQRAGAFNQAVEAFVNDDIDGFKEGVANLPDDPAF